MKAEDVHFEGNEPTISEEDLLAPKAIDELVTVELNTTINTLKIFFGIIVLLREDCREGKFEDVIRKIVNMAPVLEQVIKRSIAGFQEFGETHQTLQIIISEMQKGDLEKGKAGIDSVIKTLSKEVGNA